VVFECGLIEFEGFFNLNFFGVIDLDVGFVVRLDIQGLETGHGGRSYVVAVLMCWPRRK
jgi:hypothetical protein